jgi:hypothetical protein
MGKKFSFFILTGISPFIAFAIFFGIMLALGLVGFSLVLMFSNHNSNSYHDLTVRNSYTIPVFAQLNTTDNAEDRNGSSMYLFYLTPGGNFTAHSIIKGENLYYIITAENNSVPELREQIFVDRYIREELEALNWSVVIEPGHEETDW